MEVLKEELKREHSKSVTSQREDHNEMGCINYEENVTPLGNLQITVKEEKLSDGSHALVVIFRGHVHHYHVEYMQKVFSQWREKEIQHIIWNFAEIKTLNSTGLGLMINEFHRMKQQDNLIKIVELPKNHRMLLEMLDVKLFVEYKNVEEVLMGT